MILVERLRWKDINFADEILTLTAYKGHGRDIKPKRGVFTTATPEKE